MRIAVLLIAGVLAFGPAAHAADAPLDNAAAEAPPAAASQEAPAPESAAPRQEGGGPLPGTLPVPIPAPALAPPSGAPPVPAPAPEAAPVREPSRPPAAPPPGAGAPAAPGPSMAPVAHSPTYLSIDFTDVELPVLIKFMSEQTKRNFIFDERVQGKITIISPRRVTLEEAYDVFLSVLQAKGFTTVTQGNTIKIVAAREARQDTIRTGVSKETSPAEFITRLVPLVNLDSTEVVPLITPLVSKDGMVSAFGSSNTLLLIDSRANIDRIVTILAEVDGPGSLGVLRVYPLDFAVATEAAKTLTSIYLEGGPAAATPAAGARGRPRGGQIRGSRGIAVKFLPDARTNSVIVYAGQEMQDDVAELLKKIDVPASAGTGRISVYYLENADAEEVSKVLASLSKERTGAGPAPPAAPPGARTAPLPATGGAVISAELEGGVKVTADKATNALIIVASANDYETLVGVIKKLDIRRRQVFVEAVVMEIDLDKTLDVGVEWRGAVELGGDSALIGGANYGIQGGMNSLLAGIAAGTPLIFPGSGLVAGGIGGSVTLPDGTQVPAIAAVLRASQGNNNLNILSSPHLLTQNNKEAEIIVAENIPFITSQSRDSTNLANVINSVERKDVGVTLRLTPHIHESEFVSMDIYQEASALKQDALTLAQTATVGPTWTKRSTKTTVLVKSGDTVIISGIIQDSSSKNVSKIPLLGDIPILGYLFRYTSEQKKKTNLLIMLTPHIIQEPGAVSKPLENRQREMLDPFSSTRENEVKRALRESLRVPPEPTGEKQP
ncbi:MAG: type II secretion system secretin GspD [Deltaproteobacteria bacterium]|nr:type II secretion system secretin GspD [Candidatus Deferrimicrobium borealis]